MLPLPARGVVAQEQTGSVAGRSAQCRSFPGPALQTLGGVPLDRWIRVFGQALQLCGEIERCGPGSTEQAGGGAAQVQGEADDGNGEGW